MKVKDEPQKMTVAEQVLAICKESPEVCIPFYWERVRGVKSPVFRLCA